MRSSGLRTLVYGTELAAAVEDVRPALVDRSVRLLPCSASLQFPPPIAASAQPPDAAAPDAVTDLMALAVSPDAIDPAARTGVLPTATCAMIYSSGTSGLPKVRCPARARGQHQQRG